MDDGGDAALDHCLPSTISWPAGEAGMEGKKHPTPSQGTKKSLSKGIFLLLQVFIRRSQQENNHEPFFPHTHSAADFPGEER